MSAYVPSLSMDLGTLRATLHRHLHDHILPFWFAHAIDPQGGLNTCIADDGRVISRDKWLWSQWRAVWVFSRLYRQTRETRYLELADQIRRFCCRHGWHEDGGWRLCVGADGREIRGRDSIYVDGFALYGLAEFILANGEGDARHDAQRWARRTADHVQSVLQRPHDQIPHFPYPVPAQMRVHGIPMIFSLCFDRAGEALGDAPGDAQGDAALQQLAGTLSDEVMTRFYRADRDLVLERIGEAGQEMPAPLGTAVVPGHVIESMWFQIDIAETGGGRVGKPAVVERAIRMIRRHMELGWDETYGGLRLAIDADGAADVGWAFADTKLWWPHTEAMIALLRAHELSGEAWCLEWYQRVHAYAFEHFPHPAGEWRQRLDRAGRPIQDVVALPVKDPFHLPRALLLCTEILDRIQAGQTTGSVT